LAEGLTDSVAADVRLGLVSATAARDVGRLPRGNQDQVAQVIARRGLTTRQTTRLVDQLLGAGDERARAAILAEAERTSAPSAPRAVRAPVTTGEAMIADAGALATLATRLQVRLLERPVASLGAEVERVVVGRLGELQAVLVALCQTLAQVSSTSTTEVSHGT
jgi:hypothetical protein